MSLYQLHNTSNNKRVIPRLDSTTSSPSQTSKNPFPLPGAEVSDSERVWEPEGALLLWAQCPYYIPQWQSMPFMMR